MCRHRPNLQASSLPSWALVLTASLCSPAVCAGVAERTFTHGQWRCVTDGGVRILSGASQVALAGVYRFRAERAETVENGVRYAGTRDGKAMTITYTFADGRLLCRCEVHGEPKKDGSPRDGYVLLTTFAGGDLSDTVVLMDGQEMHIPPKLERREFRHARRFLFFRHQPAKTLAIEYPVCRFANLRDFRHGGRADLQLFAFPDTDGVVEAVFDLTEGVVLDGGEEYDGRRLMAADDLHLPDLSKSKNRVQNPGFEGGLALWGKGVADVRPPPGGGYGWTLDESAGHTGRKSARYTVARGYNPHMLCTYPIAVRKGQTYTASFYAKTDRPGAGFSVFIHTARWGQFPAKAGRRVRLSGEWKRHTVTFEAPNPFLRLCFGDRWWDHKAGDQVDGAHVWFDDVQLEAGEAATEFVQKPVFCHSTTGRRDECMALDEPRKSVTVTLVNTSGRTADCRADVSVQDLARRTLASEAIRARLDPWAEVKRTVGLDAVSTRGLLRVEMKAAAGEFQETFYGRAAVYEKISDPGKVRYALHMTPTPEEARHLQGFGVWGSLSFRPPGDPSLCKRLDEMDWLHVFTPTSDRSCPVKVFKQEMKEEDWLVYEAWLAERIRPYRDQVHWKTLNEPNCGGYTWTPAECARAVSIMRKYIRAANPAAKILTPDPYNASRGGQSWMESFLRNGGNELVDVVAIHTYRSRPEAPDLDNDIRSLVALKGRYGLAEAPIMFTEGEGTPIYSLPEIGMSPLRGFFEWRLDLLSLDVGRSEIAAAALMTRTLLACLKNGEHVKYYLSWRPDILQGQPLASLCAINCLLARLRRAEFKREYLIGNETKTYVFLTPDDEPVAVIWSHDLKIDRGEAPPVEARVPIPGPDWRLSDLMGNPVRPRVEEDRWRFEVPALPVYLVGPEGALPAMYRALEKATIGAGGVRSVEMNVRLTGRSRAELIVTNRLLRLVAGKLRLSVSGRDETARDVTLAALESANVAFALPEPTGSVNVSRVEAAFEERGAGVTRRVDDLRWFTIPPLEQPVAIDGDAADWQGHPALHMTGAEAVKSFRKGDRWGGPQDLSAECRFGYRDDGLYFCIEVRDDVFSQENPIETAWRGDSLQVYIDLMADGRDRPGLGYDSNDQSIYVAQVRGKDTLYRDYTPEWQIAFVKAGIIERGECAIRRAGDVTTYEVKLSPKEVFPLEMRPGTTFGFGLLVNDADAEGVRRQALTNTPSGTEPHGKPELWPAAVLVPERRGRGPTAGAEVRPVPTAEKKKDAAPATVVGKDASRAEEKGPREGARYPAERQRSLGLLALVLAGGAAAVIASVLVMTSRRRSRPARGRRRRGA